MSLWTLELSNQVLTWKFSFINCVYFLVSTKVFSINCSLWLWLTVNMVLFHHQWVWDLRPLQNCDWDNSWILWLNCCLSQNCVFQLLYFLCTSHPACIAVIKKYFLSLRLSVCVKCVRGRKRWCYLEHGAGECLWTRRARIIQTNREKHKPFTTISFSVFLGKSNESVAVLITIT